MAELGEVLRQLHSSEINAGIQSFYDSQWTAWLGDELNGRKAEEMFFDMKDAVTWLDAEARRQYPRSAYAILTDPL